ncbi:hypothetical protein EJF18_10619 [Clavispora lusitaniae]|uniref:Uncharacterized protein n=1 Tax=Clavispora lusitaniae TaxID=36911 RepID=A0ACD0WE26_CLALS|nr:hypothetical protein EJF14_10619 [Clavispora lusitaniae]QFZ31174.1 hypothetical protein EJF16_10619 [Clavispora lusitaniae]QFZ36842.1 hypothetical protein EJF15_10619 [Clavispora lusitaniae]QFZ42526.1 hypothetical protein EJF18_10619 [Clavispora lusitaniae]QFZ48202.1 hypothetical protein EJF17_10619 [Clavispora lusitaniae]
MLPTKCGAGRRGEETKDENTGYSRREESVGKCRLKNKKKKLCWMKTSPTQFAHWSDTLVTLTEMLFVGLSFALSNYLNRISNQLVTYCSSSIDHILASGTVQFSTPAQFLDHSLSEALCVHPISPLSLIWGGAEHWRDFLVGTAVPFSWSPTILCQVIGHVSTLDRF